MEEWNEVELGWAEYLLGWSCPHHWLICSWKDLPLPSTGACSQGYH